MASSTQASSGSSAPLALHATASAVPTPMPAIIHAMPARGASTRRERPCSQASSPSRVKVTGSIASRCTIYSVVETKSGCSAHRPAASNAAASFLGSVVLSAAKDLLFLGALMSAENRSFAARWLPTGRSSSHRLNARSSANSSAVLSRCRIRLVRRKAPGLAGQSWASIRKLSSASGRPVGSAVPEVR